MQNGTIIIMATCNIAVCNQFGFVSSRLLSVCFILYVTSLCTSGPLGDAEDPINDPEEDGDPVNPTETLK